MTREVAVTQARADLAELVSRVGYSGERILLTRHGKPLAALVPISDLEALERRPAEIGFGMPSTAAKGEQPEQPAGPMRVAAEHHEPRPDVRR